MRILTLFLAVATCLQWVFAAPLGGSELKILERSDKADKLDSLYYDKREVISTIEDEEINVLTKRDDFVLLTEFFTVLNQSGLVVPVLKILATNKVTEPLLVTGIVGFLKIQNLEDLLISTDKSGLAIDIVLKAMQDSTFFPGLFNIIQGLRNGASTSPSSSTLNMASLISALKPIATTYRSSEYSSLSSTFESISSELGIGTDGSGLLSVLNPALSLIGLGRSGSSSSIVSLVSIASTTNLIASPTKSASGSTSTVSVSSIKATVTTESTSSGSTVSSTPTSTSTSSSSSSSVLSGLLDKIKSLFGYKRDISDVRENLLSKRDNALLNSLMESLEKSGLAMSVISSVITDLSMAPFARDLITKIVKDKAITIDELQSALDNSNLLNNAIIGTLTSPKLDIIIN